MENYEPDRETLRALADDGNEKALGQRAELANADADVEGLWDLLNEGSLRAGHLLTVRAVAVADLLELQRICDAGYAKAGAELNRLPGAG